MPKRAQARKGELTSTALRAARRALTGGKRGSPIGSRVAAARAVLRERAETYADLHLKAARTALKAGKTDITIGASEWALSHVSDTDAAGAEVRPIAHGIDRQHRDAGHSSGPKIIIGLSINGGTAAALPQPAAVALFDEPSSDE